MFVVSHRGSFEKAPQNSMEAFRQSILDGCQRIELDLQLAKDNSIWISHDDFLFGITRKHERISSMTAQDLSKIRLSNGEPLPKLTDVLEHILPHIELNLELKGPKPMLAHKVCDILKQGPWRQEAYHKIIFSSFDLEPLIVLKETYPQYQRALLTESCSFWAPQVPMEALAAKIIHPQIDQVDKHFMEFAYHHHWIVVSWAPIQSVENVEPEKLWTKLKNLGVHGHCTNFPKKMLKFLENKGSHL